MPMVIRVLNTDKRPSPVFTLQKIEMVMFHGNQLKFLKNTSFTKWGIGKLVKKLR